MSSLFVKIVVLVNRVEVSTCYCTGSCYKNPTLVDMRRAVVVAVAGIVSVVGVVAGFEALVAAVAVAPQVGGDIQVE